MADKPANEANKIADTNTAYDNLPAMLAIVDENAKIIFVNTAFEETAGISRKKITKTPLTNWLEDKILQSAIKEIAQNKYSSIRYDTHLKYPQTNTNPARAIPVHIVAGQISSTNPAEKHFAIQILELAQKNKQAKQAEQASQTAAHQNLLMNLAHEIKNPLGGLRGAAQLLQMELESEELKEYTHVIINEADRLQTLVDQILAPHRHTNKPKQNINIHEICEHIAALIQAQYPKEINIKRDYDTSIPEIKADKQSLMQAILNIAQNAALAIKETPQQTHKKEQITLKTRIKRQITIKQNRHKLALYLQIIDTGPGIAPHIKDKIFAPLTSAREGGSGLGLTIAQTLINQQGGEIDFESKAGHTSFNITIPIQK